MRVSRAAAIWAAALLGACGGAGDGGGEPGEPLRFENLRVEDVAGTRGVVHFDTTVPTSCDVIFGTAADALEDTATDPDMEPGELALAHSVPLEDLAPETRYYLRARGTDASGRMETSELLEFATTSSDDATAGRQNVALIGEGTTVIEVSSNWSGGDNDSGFGIHKALDGSMSSEWSSDGDGDDAYVELDLGAERELTYFAFRSRMMNDGTSIVTSVRIIDLDDAGREPEVFATPDHTVRYVFALAQIRTTRRVRIEAVTTTGGNTGAKEIQLFK